VRSLRRRRSSYRARRYIRLVATATLDATAYGR